MRKLCFAVAAAVALMVLTVAPNPARAQVYSSYSGGYYVAPTYSYGSYYAVPTYSYAAPTYVAPTYVAPYSYGSYYAAPYVYGSFYARPSYYRGGVYYRGGGRWRR